MVRILKTPKCKKPAMDVRTIVNPKNRYEHLIADLYTTGKGTMKCRGNSMLPILKNPSLCEYEVRASYDIGDIVLAKIGNRWIDAHKIYAKKTVKGEGWMYDIYQIGNNHGHINGWTRNVFAKVVRASGEGWSKEFK